MHLDIFTELTKEELLTPIREHMVPVETAFQQHLTVGELLSFLQGKSISHEVSYFYAIDKEKKLCGVVGTRDILFSEPHVKLSDILRHHVIHIAEDATLEAALGLMTKHELLALPVTNKEGELCGIFELSPAAILSEGVVAGMTKPTRDVFQLIGLSVEQGKLTSSRKEFRYRMPWLLCNLTAGLLCATIAKAFHGLLDDIVVIAMFIPLVLTLGESVAMQSMTLSLQFLHYRKIPWKRVVKRVMVEWKTAVLLGTTSALLVSCVYFLWYADYWPMIAIGSSIFLSMMAVTTFGSILPIVLHFLSLDPKVASGPVVLMLTDIFVTLLYLSISNWLLVN